MARRDQQPVDYLLRVIDTARASHDAMAAILARHSALDHQSFDELCEITRRLVLAESVHLFVVAREPGASPYLSLAGQSSENGVRVEHERFPIRSRRRSGLTAHLAHQFLASDNDLPVRLSKWQIQRNPYVRGRHAPYLADGRAASLLVFPIRNRKGDLIGLVRATNKRPAHRRQVAPQFGDDDALSAALLSTWLGTALVGQSVIAFYRSLRERAPLPQWLDSTLRGVLALVHADGGSLAFLEPTDRQPDGALIVHAQVGAGLRGVGKTVPLKSAMHHARTTKKTHALSDVRNSPYSFSPKTRSGLAVPLSTRDPLGNERIHGVLSVEWFKLNAFDERDQTLLESTATVIAQAWATSQSERSLREALAGFSTTALQVSDRNALANDILRRVSRVYGFDSGLFYLADEAPSLTLVAHLNCDHVRQPFSIELSKSSLATSILNSGEARFVAEPYREAGVWRKGLRLFRIQGPLIGLPLSHAGMHYGVMMFWSSTNTPPPDRSHLLELQAFASIAAAEIGFWRAHRLLDSCIHELVNPTTTIQTVLDSPDAPIPEDLPLLKRESHRIFRLVQQTDELRFQRLNAPEPAWFDVGDAVRGVVASLTSRASQHKIQIVTFFPQCDLRIHTDRLGFDAALANIVSNAINFSPDGSRIEIHVFSRARRSIPWYYIGIRDKGPGIPPDRHRKIFEPFVRSFTHRKSRGTGIGLTIAHRHVVANGGRIELESSPGNGSCFTVCIPRERK